MGTRSWDLARCMDQSSACLPINLLRRQVNDLNQHTRTNAGDIIVSPLWAGLPRRVSLIHLHTTGAPASCCARVEAAGELMGWLL